MPATRNRQLARHAGRTADSPVLVLRQNLRMPQRVFARLVCVSERSLAKFEKGQQLTESVQRQVTALARLQEALAMVVDKRTIGDWFQRPNTAFGGLKPLEVVERGEIDRLWQMVYELESGTPG